ncbi:peptidoglycan DD-metalloendopeptidase family protein [Deinococcus sp.]|uniref:LysM peptidoglycan-binding domain-containing M23 family metallopeptidase n=1 Tax=Deinococcus sp. TaxID=47478 RepID=UPI0026004285|nr:peptidoglycan DD-metalloendopeptidase family protein [Deinococcus sp.]
MKAITVALFLPLLTLGLAHAYTVKKGDTLYSLARANNLKVEELRRLNNLGTESIRIGQELRLSAREPLPLTVRTPVPPVPLKYPESEAPVKPVSTTQPVSPVKPPAPVKAPVTSNPAQPARPASGGFTLTPPSAEPLPPVAAPPRPSTSNPGTASPVKPSPVKPTLPQPSATAPRPTTKPVPAAAIPVRSGSSFEVGGVSVALPTELSMGDAFIVKLSGKAAAQATVRFPSEIGEDVRQPNEVLTPFGAAGVYVAPGRVVLGKKTPVIVEIRVAQEVVRAIVPLRNQARGAVVALKLAPLVAKKLTDPGKAAEDEMVNQGYFARGAPLWTRPFVAPLDRPPLRGSFGQSRTYVAGGPVAYHYGADYPAALGSPVRAVNDGKVLIAGQFPVRGGLVMIDHGGGVTSLYFHQSKVQVHVGEQVSRGQVIGQVGTTGISEGPHLHLEIRVRGEATQPENWINRLWP